MLMDKKPAYHFKKAPYHAFVVENNNVGIHLHRHAEISYITDGMELFYIEDTPYKLYAGDLIIVFPNQLHKLVTPDYCKAITCIFDANFTSDYTSLLNNYHMDCCVFHKDELSPATLSALNPLAKTGITKSFKCRPLPFTEKGYLSVILADLFSKHKLIAYDPTSPAFIVTAFFNYVETHLGEDLSLTTIAKNLKLSSSHLSSLITYNTGQSPHTLVNARRLDHARTLLYKTNKPIHEIAKETGFSSERSFYRNFKEKYNKTPLEFRKKKTAAQK